MKINLLQEVTNQTGVLSIEELACYFEGALAWLSLAIPKGQTAREAFGNITQRAVEAVKSGVLCLVLDDTEAISAKRCWLDPILATSAVDTVLRITYETLHFRRKAGIVVRQREHQNLHDIILLCSFGADAVNPYAMLAVPQYLAKSKTEGRTSRNRMAMQYIKDPAVRA